MSSAAADDDVSYPRVSVGEEIYYDDNDYNSSSSSSDYPDYYSNGDGGNDENLVDSILLNYPYYIEGLAIFAVGTVGLFINGMAMYLLGRQRQRRVFHCLLLSLSTFDFLHCFLSVACFSLPQLSTAYRNHVLIFSIPYLIPLAQITLSSSSLSTVALTVERYISVCWPYFCYR